MATLFSSLPSLSPKLLDKLHLPHELASFPFPYQAIADDIAKLFTWPNLNVTILGSQFTSLSKPSASDNLLVLNLALPPLTGSIVMILPKECIEKISRWLFPQADHAESYTPIPFSEGIYQFLVLKTLRTIETFQIFGQTTLRLNSQQASFPLEGLKYSIALEKENERLLFDLFLTSEFLKQWEQRPAFLRKVSVSANISNLPVEVDLEIGTIDLNAAIWTDVKAGDLLIVDRCTIDPQNQEGTLCAKTRSVPLFEGKWKNNTLKILQFVIDQEMTIPNSSIDPNQDAVQELNQQPDSALNQAPQDLGTNPTQDQVASLERQEVDENPSAEVDGLSDTLEKSDAVKVEAPSTQASLPLDKIPVTLHLFAGSIAITVDQLVALQIGQVLELSAIDLEKIDCYVEGKKVASGRLIQIDQTMGLQITWLETT